MDYETKVSEDLYSQLEKNLEWNFLKKNASSKLTEVSRCFPEKAIWNVLRVVETEVPDWSGIMCV